MYYGKNELSWQVLGTRGSGGSYKDQQESPVGEESALFLLAKKELQQMWFSKNNSNIYKDSELKQYLNNAKVQTNSGDDLSGYISGNFTEAEWNEILKTTKSAGNNCAMNGYTYVDAALSGDLLFALSANELQEYLGYTSDSSTWSSGRIDTDWWLRSAVVGNSHDTGAVNDDGYPYDRYAFHDSVRVRPAFNLNLNSVLFTSAAESGKSSSAEGGADAISEIKADPKKGWKLTLKDAERNAFTAETTAINGKKLTVTYTGAKTGTGEYLSAMIVDDTSGEYTHYGKLKTLENLADSSDTVEIDLSEIDMTGKSLYVFNEQDNGDKKTDYASPMRKVKIDPVQYKIAKGDESTWKKGSKDGLTITVDGDYAKFSGLKIDEKTVEKEAYTAESGSTVIRLAPEYLEKLSVGSHSIAILYTDGKAEGTFTIADADTSGGDPSDQKTPGSDPSDQKTPGGDTGDSDRSVDPQAGTQPQTGDNNPLSLWIMLLLLSLAGIGGTVVCSRRKALNSK